MDNEEALKVYEPGRDSALDGQLTGHSPPGSSLAKWGGLTGGVRLGQGGL